MTQATARPVIVAGIDGSPASRDALRWATKQAELTGAQLHAVIAGRWPAASSEAAGYSYLGEFAARARKALDDVVTETLGAT